MLTTREVADYLRLKERKIYDLVASNDIPHVRVTGKILFPRSLIDTWLLNNTQYGPGAELLRQPAMVVAGSHDPLLEWALMESGAGLASGSGPDRPGLPVRASLCGHPCAGFDVPAPLSCPCVQAPVSGPDRPFQTRPTRRQGEKPRFGITLTTPPGYPRRQPGSTRHRGVAAPGSEPDPALRFASVRADRPVSIRVP